MPAYKNLPKVNVSDLKDMEGQRIIIDGCIHISGGKIVGPYFIVPEQSIAMHTKEMLMDNSTGIFVPFSRLQDKNPRVIPADWIY